MRQFFCRRFDGRRACRVEVLPACEGEPALHFPLLPDSIAIKEHGEDRREADGEAVSSHDNGRTATTSYIAGCHRVLAASRSAGCCAAAPGSHTVCYSCDAGTVASRSKSSNTWTCGGVRCADRSDGNCSLQGYALLVETASGDKLSALRESMAPILPAMSFHARHDQLPCCEHMLAVARAACRCTASESCATPNCEPASCPALTCARPCACGDARPAMLPCKLVVTGDLANLHAMMGLGSVRTDTAHNSTHVTFDDEGVSTDRTYADAARYAHAAIGETCPSCGYVPGSAADVEAERQKRIAMPSGPAVRDAALAQNHLFAPLIPYLEFDHYLLGVMHFCHNTFDQFLSSVFKDIDALHGDDANLVKHDVITCLRNMGLGILPPASPRACATEQTLPKFKGSELSILRTDMGMLTILQLVYGADEVLDAGAPAEEQPSSARDLAAVTALEAAMRARRAGRVSTARVLAAVRTARTSALRRACKALMLLWEVHALLKLTTYDDSTAAGREGHARAFETKFAEFDQALRAMTSKSIDSLYFSEGKHAVGNLIRRWGRTVAFVNEQVRTSQRLTSSAELSEHGVA